MRDIYDLSFIIPVYNTEEYIEKCVNSVVGYKWMHKVEVIIIDDGSTDSSPEVCDSIANRYDNVKCLHICNGGLSNARNIGILQSQGKYVGFIDSDDYIDATIIDDSLKVAFENDIDIIAGDIIDFKDESELEAVVNTFPETGIYDARDYLLERLKKNIMRMCAPVNIYRKELVMNNNLFFEKGLIHEDELWTPQMFLAAGRVYHIGKVVYYRFVREGSITTSKKQYKAAKDLVYICNTLEKKYQVLSEPLKKELCDYLAVIYMGAYEKGRLYKDKEDRLFPIRHAINKKTKIKAVLLAVNGRLFCTFYGGFRFLKNR